MKLLALPFLLLSIGVHANPYSGVQVQANVLNYIDAVSPTLYMLDACQSEEFMPIFLYSIEQTYKLALVRDAKGKRLVDSMWATHEYSMETNLRTSLMLVRQGLRNETTRPEVIEACAAMTKTVKNRFQWLYHIMKDAPSVPGYKFGNN